MALDAHAPTQPYPDASLHWFRHTRTPWQELQAQGLPYHIDGVLYNDDLAIGRWINLRSRTDVDQTTDPRAGDPSFKAFGVLDTLGFVIGGVQYMNHRHRDIEASVAVDDIAAARPAVFRRVLYYPFVVLGVDGLTVEILADNIRCIAAIKALQAYKIGEKRHNGSVLYALDARHLHPMGRPPGLNDRVAYVGPPAV